MMKHFVIYPGEFWSGFSLPCSNASGLGSSPIPRRRNDASVANVPGWQDPQVVPYCTTPRGLHGMGHSGGASLRPCLAALIFIQSALDLQALCHGWCQADICS